jgi:hypothetical protein
MTTTFNHRLAATTMCIALAATAITACGDDTAASSSETTTADPQTARPSTTSPATVAAPATSAVSTTSTAPPSTDDERWRQEAAAVCAAYTAALPSVPAPEAVGWVQFVATWRDLHDRLPSLASIAYPADLRTPPVDVPAVMQQADGLLARAETAAAAGDDAAADSSIGEYLSLLEHAAALVTVGGAECGDPTRAANASLNVPIPDVHQVSTGFGSVWASRQVAWGDVVRVDPASGEVLASIDVGATPVRSQPADGRMIVRTADAYVAIDPATNTVVATLAKADVGPAANRSWAVDGAMWICDGQRLHRYDPATFMPTGTVIELGIDCGNVFATPDLVVAWNYNEDPGPSGIAAAVFIDPATNQVLATTPLPADATVPIVLDDAVFFPGSMATTNAVVDRSTWTVTATPDYGRELGNGPTSDGRSIYVIADDKDVLVIDARTYEQTDVIEPLTIFDHLNALAAGPGALWVATGTAGILQRFDIP